MEKPIIDHIYIGPDPKNKTAIIVDDMISSGDSIIDVAKQLKEKGIKILTSLLRMHYLLMV